MPVFIIQAVISCVYGLILKTMKNLIKKITKKVPQEVTLPDGLYNAIWSGFIISLSYENNDYELETVIGVKGINIKVIVEVNSGYATFDTVRV